MLVLSAFAAAPPCLKEVILSESRSRFKLYFPSSRRRSGCGGVFEFLRYILLLSRMCVISCRYIQCTQLYSFELNSQEEKKKREEKTWKSTMSRPVLRNQNLICIAMKVPVCACEFVLFFRSHTKHSSTKGTFVCVNVCEYSVCVCVCVCVFVYV